MKKTKQAPAPVHWQPNPGPQTDVLTCFEREILYGGARGGGKTDASQAWLTRWFDNPKLKFLVIRRNADDLRDYMIRAREMWKHFNPEWTRNEVRLPSGASGFFGHLCDDQAYEKYQGQEFQKVIIEELTHIPNEELYLKLIASCRSTAEGLTPQVFCTTNPGNAGHLWVRRRFVDVAPPGKTFGTVDARGVELTRVFIPAKVEDNPILVEKDPGYVSFLESLPKNLRQAWRDGSWDDFEVEGAYYTKWMQEAKEKGRITGVPHETSLPVHTWWDLGIGDSMAIGFFQRIGKEWHMVDYYENSGEGIDFYVKVLRDKGYVYGEHWAPHDIEVRELTNGKTRKETAKALGIDFKVVPDLPVDDGINAVRMRFNQLWFDEKKCAQFLNAVKQYRKEWDEKRNEFKNKPYHDWTSHAADMFRYWAVTEKRADAGKVFRHPA